MAIIEDVEVQIVSKSTGLPLAEFDDPNKEASENGKEVRRYIEAVTDSEFEFVVRLKKGFSYRGADGIWATFDIDGGALHRSIYWERPTGHSRSKALKNDVLYRYSSTKVSQGAEWSWVSFSFGAARVDEDLHLDDMTLEKQFARLGSLSVRVKRVQSRPGKEIPFEGADLQPAEDLDKKLIVKSITHTIKFGKARSAKKPMPDITRETCIKGEAGKPLVFEFLYRSHLALQTLGCIPSTPEPVPLAERSPAEMTSGEKDGQIVQLRAENAAQRDENASQREEISQLKQAAQAHAQELEGARELKTKLAGLQSLLGSLASTTTTTPPSSNVKAERIKSERDDRTTRPAHPAKRRKPEYIDLD